MTAVISSAAGGQFATVSRERGSHPRVSLCRFDNGANRDAELKRLLERRAANRYPATTLLDRDDYQLLLVEAPDVRPDELRAAVRWRIKDLIGFHIDDAVIDVFEIPDQRHVNRNRMMYAVAARARRVRERAEQLEAVGLALDSIDIPEMAVRNLAMLVPEESRGLALIHLGDDSGIITLSRQGTLYLTRRLDIGMRVLDAAPDIERDALCDAVLLEVQRSLDYYESHFPHGPVAALALTPTTARTSLADFLPGQVEIPVIVPALEELLAFDEPPADLDGDGILAIGAALRQEERAL